MDTRHWAPDSGETINIFKNTALARFQPEPGSISVNRKIITEASRVLNGEIYADVNHKLWAFAYFAQLVDSAVLHEKVYYRDATNSPAERSSHFDLVEDIIHPLPGIPEFEQRASVLIIDNETQKVFKPDPVDIDLDLLASSVAGIPYKPDPASNSYTQGLIVRREQDYYRYLIDETMGSIARIAQRRIENTNRILHEARFTLDSPLVFNFVLSEHRRDQDIFETVIRVRDSKEARAFRSVCAEFDMAARVGDSNTMYRLQDELQGVLDKLNYKFQKPTVKIDIQFPPAISFNSLELWQFVHQRRKRHIAFIENIYEAALKSEGIRHQFYRFF